MNSRSRQDSNVSSVAACTQTIRSRVKDRSLLTNYYKRGFSKPSLAIVIFVNIKYHVFATVGKCTLTVECGVCLTDAHFEPNDTQGER